MFRRLFAASGPQDFLRDQTTLLPTSVRAAVGVAAL